MNRERALFEAAMHRRGYEPGEDSRHAYRAGWVMWQDAVLATSPAIPPGWPSEAAADQGERT